MTHLMAITKLHYGIAGETVYSDAEQSEKDLLAFNGVTLILHNVQFVKGGQVMPFHAWKMGEGSNYSIASCERPK